MVLSPIEKGTPDHRSTEHYTIYLSSTYSQSPLESATKPIERQSITEHSPGTGGKWQPSKPLSQIALFHSAVATTDVLSSASLMHSSPQRPPLHCVVLVHDDGGHWKLPEPLVPATYYHTYRRPTDRRNPDQSRTCSRSLALIPLLLRCMQIAIQTGCGSGRCCYCC